MTRAQKIEAWTWGVTIAGGILVWCFATPPANANAQAHLRAMVNASAARNGVPANLLHGIIKTESGYRCSAHNKAGGVHGIGQLKLETARSVGISGSLYDCQNGIEAAARYLAISVRLGGSPCVVASRYERGVYAAPICTAYGRTVLRNAQS